MIYTFDDNTCYTTYMIYDIYIYRKYINVVSQYDNIMLYNMLNIRDRHIV